MRFLLLCPVALLLLTAPAKTIATDSVEVESVPTQSPPNNSTTTESASGEPLDSSPPPATTAQTSAPSESASSSTELAGENTGDKPVLDQPDPKALRKLKRRLAKAQAELKVLTEDNTVLEASLQTLHSKMTKLVAKRVSLAGELQTTRRKLREAQAKLNPNDPQEERCKPSESEVAELIAEETSRLLEKRKAALRQIIERKYQDTLTEMRLKIRRELNLIDPPGIFNSSFYIIPRS